MDMPSGMSVAVPMVTAWASFRVPTMPKGPQGQKRPADVIGNAVTVARIATGEAEEQFVDDGKNKAAQALGAKGGKARAERLTSEQRSAIARDAAIKRWTQISSTKGN